MDRRIFFKIVTGLIAGVYAACMPRKSYSSSGVISSGPSICPDCVHDETEKRSGSKFIEIDGIECKIFYNYVAPYCYGRMPMNCWWGSIDYKNYCWSASLSKNVKTFEQARDTLIPIFRAVILRSKQRNLL